MPAVIRPIAYNTLEPIGELYVCHRISSFEKKIDGDWWIEIDHWL